MPFLPSLPDDAVVLDVFQAFPHTARPLIEYHEALMRGPSPFSPRERELIAAYVSGLNACQYCVGVHGHTAQAFGMDEHVLVDMVDDVDTADVDERLKPLLRFVRKLTVEPAKMVQADADAVFAASWDERALHDAVSVCALFNFMNRFVEAIGLEGDATYFTAAAERISSRGYIRMLDAL